MIEEMELGLSQNGLQRFGGGWHWRAATVALVDGGWVVVELNLRRLGSRHCFVSNCTAVYASLCFLYKTF